MASSTSFSPSHALLESNWKDPITYINCKISISLTVIITRWRLLVKRFFPHLKMGISIIVKEAKTVHMIIIFLSLLLLSLQFDLIFP